VVSSTCPAPESVNPLEHARLAGQWRVLRLSFGTLKRAHQRSSMIRMVVMPVIIADPQQSNQILPADGSSGSIAFPMKYCDAYPHKYQRHYRDQNPTGQPNPKVPPR